MKFDFKKFLVAIGILTLFSAAQANAQNEMFKGGLENGAIFQTKNIASCSSSAFAIFSGGFESGKWFAGITKQNCTAEQINPYGGGSTGNNQQAFQKQPSCNTLSLNTFSGGASQGIQHAQEIKSNCVLTSLSTFSGGSAGSVQSSKLTSSICNPLSLSSFSGGPGDGDFFVLDPNADCFFSNASLGTIPSSACPGSTIQINGSGLLNVTAVLINGVASPSFTINSSYSITAAIPKNATSGPLTIVAGGNNINSTGNVNILTAPKVTVTPTGQVSLCSGQFLLKATTTENNFLWSTSQTASSINVNQPGKYWVTVTAANGCKAISDTVTATPASLPVATFSFNQTNGFTFQFNNQSLNAKTVKWDFGDGSTSSQSNPSYQYSSTGTFLVKLIAENDCGKDTFETAIVINPTHLDNRGETEVFVYPNPFRDQLYLEVRGTDPGLLTVSLYDLAGKLLFKQQIHPQQAPSMLDINGLHAGIYNLQIISGRGILNRKILKASRD